MPRKLGVTSSQRKAMLRNLASDLLWYGKIETTEARAKETRSYTEKLITLAINTYTDNVETQKVETNEKGKEVTITVVKDGVKKLAARRKLMKSLFDLQEVRAFKEKKADFKKRTADINHPLIEKIFNEIAPKYAERKEELGQGGGYTRILKCGPRKGDAAEVAIIELI
ncbi:MAG: 50S ribosomal protein L17 [Clostridia bacterium]|nr:50S ribosomal protein L17 [Clostridia bacterium]